jgi:N-acetylglucosaminyl-diphospho-decaprenol L-rhamnosyltransferase
MSDVDVATIIVNYRTAAATIEAVSALWGDLEGLSNPLVVIVDNDSRDGSLEQLREAFAAPQWGGRVVVVDAKSNGGFGKGVNVGIETVIKTRGIPPYVYVLNPDATIEPGALKGLLAFMAEHPKAGLLGNTVRNLGADVLKAFRFPTVLSELEGSASLGPLTRLLRRYRVPMNPTESCEVDWVSGVSMLFRGEVFSSAGFFDEGFFLYFEEIDLAKRVRAAGWKIYFVADVSVNHVNGLSTGFTDESRQMPRYWFESRRRYFVKHHGRLYSAACDAAWILGHGIFMTRATLGRRSDSRRPSVGRDLFRYSISNLFKPAPVAEQNRPGQRAPDAR